MFNAILCLSLLVAADDAELDASDIHRFPYAESECKRRWEMAKAHHEWLEKNRSWDSDWMCEACYRMECWHALYELKRTVRTEGVEVWRTLQLKQLQLMIGKRELYLGIMPDHLPEARFREIK